MEVEKIHSPEPRMVKQLGPMEKKNCFATSVDYAPITCHIIRSIPTQWRESILIALFKRKGLDLIQEIIEA